MDSESNIFLYSHTAIEFRKRLKKPTRTGEKLSERTTKYQVTRCFSKCDNNRKVNYKSIIKMAPKDGFLRDLFIRSSELKTVSE